MITKIKVMFWIPDILLWWWSEAWCEWRLRYRELIRHSSYAGDQIKACPYIYSEYIPYMNQMKSCLCKSEQLGWVQLSHWFSWWIFYVFDKGLAGWLVDLSLLNLQIRRVPGRVRQQSWGLSQVIPPVLINPISSKTPETNHLYIRTTIALSRSLNLNFQQTY